MGTNENAGPAPLRPLSAESVRLAAAKRNPMAETSARFGPVVAKKLHGVFGSIREFDAPLVQAVIDHTQLGTVCINPGQISYRAD